MRMSLPLFQNTYILRSPKVATFADIIRITTMFIETTFNDSEKVKRIRNYMLKYDRYLFLDVPKITDFQ